MRKIPTEGDVKKIGVALSAQLAAAMEAWKAAMTCYRIDSMEYKSICRAGKKTQKAYQNMLLEAEKVLDGDEVRKYFTVNTGCSFN